jgi:hypothetical protein
MTILFIDSTEKLMKCRILFFGFLWIIPFTLSGQRYINGCVTDAETGEPIPGVSVFIDRSIMANPKFSQFLLHLP